MIPENFDYIIVGAGSAGCVLANKLSESGRYKILLVEAGGTDRKFWIKVPLGYGFTFSDPKVNWRYNAENDPGLNGRGAYWPRGRVLGGSSSINAMAYSRGLPDDYDDWEAAGATGWNWGQVEQAYDALEINDEFGADGKRQVRGDGALWISDLSDQMHPFSQRFLQAAKDIGWPVTDNFNGPEKDGLSLIRSTVRKGFRWSSADAFLRPAKKRTNLHVVTNALVEKIIINEGRATGIRYRMGDRTHETKAACEVILSAGAINSPQLLQLSGVGPAGLLKQHNIGVEHDLSQVGQGLQDHLAVSHFYQANEPTLNNRLGNKLGQLLAGIQYVLTRRGPLSVPVNQCGGFIRSDVGSTGPDVQVYCNPASYSVPASGQPKMDKEPGFLLSVQPCRPTSRGEVNIASSNPSDAPIIQPNSLSTEHDQHMAIRASKLLQNLAESPTISKVTRERSTPDITTMTDAELLENFRARAGTVFHPSCTCRMGRDENDSVLDARLRVHGIRGLRVVDASAFPNVTSGNTNAPTIMLATKAAKMVLQDAEMSV
ncbi:MAG: GMC family oxidoreductase N-terminal domain-containing protein [Halopseudomonas aestusnigri]